MRPSKFLLSLTAAATLTLSAFGVQAQANAPQQAEKPRVSQAQRAEALKQKLNLAPNQLAAWDRYQAALHPAGGPGGPGDRGPRGEGQPRGDKGERPQLTDAQKAERHQRMETHRQARESATQAFYAQLSPAQQQVFDAETRRPDHRGGQGRPNR